MNPGLRQLAFVLVLTFASLLLVKLFDASEALSVLAHQKEAWQFFVVFMVLALALGLFSARRWSELRKDIQNREKAELTLKESYEFLKAQLAEGTSKLVESVASLKKESSAREQAQKALEESERRYQDMLDNAKDLIQVVAPDGRFLYVNRAWKRAIGYSDEEANRMSLGDVVHPKDRERIVEIFERAISGETQEKMEALLVTREGKNILVEGSANCTTDGGKPSAGFGIFRDITERRRSERRLAAQYSTARVLAGAANLSEAAPRLIKGICEWLDWDVGSLWTLSPGGEELRCADVWHVPSFTGDAFEAETRRLTFARGVGIPGRVLSFAAPAWEADVLRADGFSRAASAAQAGLHASFVFPIMLRSEVLGVMEFFCRDVRQVELDMLAMAAAVGIQIAQFIEAKRSDQGLRVAKEAAETANRAKSQFLANMSHELRTPLNSVIGFTNILLRKKDQMASKESLYLKRILVSGKHLLGLINQTLDLAKIESGREEIDRSPVSLPMLVRDVIVQSETQIRNRSVRLEIDAPPSVAPIKSDPGKLKQVLINLVANALKFTETGSVTVRVRCQPPGNEPTRIDVVDTGIGIPKDRLQAVFEAFQQADNTTARKYGGTGLGLAISRSLCDLLGYRLTAETVEGKGSVFSIHLTDRTGTPEAAQDADPASERAPQGVVQGKPRTEEGEYVAREKAEGVNV